MQIFQTAALRGRIKIVAVITSLLGSSACTSLHGLNANHTTSPDSSYVTGCSPISSESPERLAIEAEIAAFVRTTPGSDAARFEVQNCLMDGQLSEDNTIILSSRLARLPQPQRHFIIAHEFAHYRLAHYTQIGGVPARILDHKARTTHAGDVTEHAHRREFDADAYAVHIMQGAGLDPEQAAQLFDSMGAGEDSDTHPAFSRRAKAIRDLIAALSNDNDGSSAQVPNASRQGSSRSSPGAERSTTPAGT